MNTQKDMDDIAAAVRKIVDNLDEARTLDAGKAKKYQALSR
jgi:hypothetical protein